ncbi:hypothetical protein Halru_0074 [Halovivax ruber XH-70]|uniref:Uncharacterized protein n=1 Tax=Halovivax ruber (strain DSM 18193 / JCM 13892 / XH-70) TaxID=797302 RepID=L0I908_HALRX|nr:hypothetical protein [Halovivax ruber]AGB14726.1 hypothetical protein Halru_0074 [Halovivax ruber XH-70]
MSTDRQSALAVTPSLTAVSFWAGTLLPIVYLPLLLAGVDSGLRFGLLVALLALNVVALVLGHDYPRA